MIKYTNNLENLDENMLSGFFVGWLNPPSSSAHMRILKGSYCVWLAIDTEINKVVGFINAISDGVLSAYIPLLEVLPEYKKSGIGKTLFSHMLDSLKGFYMIDVVHDKELQGYYAQFGMFKHTASCLRNHKSTLNDSYGG